MSLETERVEQTDGNYERLKKVRAGNRAVVTKFEREAGIIIRDHGNSLTTDLIAKLDLISIALKRKQTYLATLDEEILAKCKTDEIEKEIEEATKTSS